jgi:Uma2 family endonuclease
MGVPKAKHQTYSYADYLGWDDGRRWEVINGLAYDMSPAPNTEHQRISMFFSVTIGNYLQNKKCSVFSAPFDVRLSENASDEAHINNVVQPDISVICDPGKMDEKGAIGAPDWVIEIVSPSTVKHDFGTKLLLYQKFGVKEYWIVDPETKSIHVYQIDGSGKYNPGKVYNSGDMLEVGIFEDLKITVHEVFKK